MDKTETKQSWEYDGTPRVLTWQNRSPISGKWQIPYGVTLVEPPSPKEGYTLRFNGKVWKYEELPKEPVSEPYIPTREEKLAQLVAQYESDKAEILKYYADAMIHGDTELMAELAGEITELDEQYATDYKALKEGE